MEEKSAIEQEMATLLIQRDNLKVEFEAYKKEIDSATEGRPTLRSLMTSRLSAMESTINIISSNVEKINLFHSEILQPKEGSDKSQFDLFKEASGSISLDKLKSEAELKAIEKYKIELLGDQEKNIIGFKQRIEDLEIEINSKKRQWEENVGTLFKKIEGLLPGATATGLAKAYQDQRISYNKPYWGWAVTFVATICCIIWFAILNLNVATSVEDAFLKVITRLPFFVPAFWLAIFASKQQSQNKRLQQEYAHKEVLAKSYEADKREIEKLPDSPEKAKLSEKLLETMIDSAKFNPSETLGSKTHNDGPPSVFELFKIKMLKKLSGGAN